MRVLGIDPGFAMCGLVAVNVGDGLALSASALIETQKTDAKRHVLVAEDNFERARHIANRIRSLVVEMDIEVVCAESMSLPRNASSAAKVAMCWGVIASVCEEFKLPLVQPTPQGVKKALTGRRDASKDEIAAEACSRLVGLADALDGWPKTKRHHVSDAAAVVLASLESDLIRMGRKLSKGAA